MDCNKIGILIFKLRKDKNITQKQLADKLNISDRTISKWERGGGIPDISLLSDIADFFDITIETLLNGEILSSSFIGGNMKKSKYYVCKTCGNIIVSTGNASVMCCDKKMTEETAQKALDSDKLCVEEVENDWYITCNHSMIKDHYISFVAFATGSKLQIVKQYPEWDLQVRFQKREHGTLFWYCTQHGLFYQHL
jgi:DNA-binding XRE family transcriptional regulator/desulfoferrodoxin (superoxide reductase-like protein)